MHMHIFPISYQLVGGLLLFGCLKQLPKLLRASADLADR
jgi:hypothetical protein